MSGTMMWQALTTGSLIAHAEKYHAGTEIVSVETDGSVGRSTWGEVGANARRFKSALDGLGVSAGARCATIAWNNRRHLELYFGIGSGGCIVCPLHDDDGYRGDMHTQKNRTHAHACAPV